MPQLLNHNLEHLTTCKISEINLTAENGWKERTKMQCMQTPTNLVIEHEPHGTQCLCLPGWWRLIEGMPSPRLRPPQHHGYHAIVSFTSASSNEGNCHPHLRHRCQNSKDRRISRWSLRSVHLHELDKFQTIVAPCFSLSAEVVITIGRWTGSMEESERTISHWAGKSNWGHD
jgi:hypothetical protein